MNLLKVITQLTEDNLRKDVFKEAHEDLKELFKGFDGKNIEDFFKKHGKNVGTWYEIRTKNGVAYFDTNYLDNVKEGIRFILFKLVRFRPSDIYITGKDIETRVKKINQLLSDYNYFKALYYKSKEK